MRGREADPNNRDAFLHLAPDTRVAAGVGVAKAPGTNVRERTPDSAPATFRPDHGIFRPPAVFTPLQAPSTLPMEKP